MGKDSYRKRRRSRGNFVQVQYSMMDSAAWLDLGGSAVKLLLHLMKLSQGNNGWGHKDEPGKLFLSERQAAEAIGVSRNTASKAFAELIAHGFLRVVQAGHFDVKIKLATVWRLTFEPCPRTHKGPTNEWLQWRPEQNSRAQNLNSSGAKIDQLSSDRPFTGAEIAPDNRNNGGKQPKLIGSNSAPHLDMPEGVGVPESAAHANLVKSPLNSAGGPIAAGKAA